MTHLPTEREGDQPVTMTEDRRQREQMLALSQVTTAPFVT